MKLVLCVLLGVILSVRAATLPPFELSTQDVMNTTMPSTSEAWTTTPYATTPVSTTTPVTTTTPVISCNTHPGSTTPPAPPEPPTTPDTPSEMMCPDGWQVFEGCCYLFMGTPAVTWSQAQSTCALMESTLASVHSVQEYGFLQQLTTSNQYNSAWLGGFYLQDQWLWLDGSWFYNNNNTWAYMNTESSNLCLVLNSNEGWSNSACNPDVNAYICVKPSNVPTSMLCPQGWTGFMGRCYYYNQNSLTWADADTYCAGFQASLVSVHSPQEYDFLFQQISGIETWLGGFYLEDQWVWLDGSWFYQGLFTDMSVPDTTQACLSMYTGGWTNFPCENNYPSFCVKNAVV